MFVLKTLPSVLFWSESRTNMFSCDAAPCFFLTEGERELYAAARTLFLCLFISAGVE